MGHLGHQLAAKFTRLQSLNQCVCSGMTTRVAPIYGLHSADGAVKGSRRRQGSFDELALQSFSKKFHDSVVESAEVTGAVGPHGGEDAAATDSRDNADVSEEVSIVEGSKAAKPKGSSTKPAS